MLALADWAKVGAAAANDNLLDRCSADLAGLAFAGVDAVLELKEAGDACSVHVVRDGGAAQRDGAGEDVHQRKAQAFEIGTGESGGLSSRANGGAGEGLVGVDITDAM